VAREICGCGGANGRTWTHNYQPHQRQTKRALIISKARQRGNERRERAAENCQDMAKRTHIKREEVQSMKRGERNGDRKQNC